MLPAISASIKSEQWYDQQQCFIHWKQGGKILITNTFSSSLKNIFMDFNFLNCLCALNIPTGNTDAFAHETKIMAKSAIKANNYNHTVTFIVLQLKMRTCWIKNKQRCTHHPIEPCAVIWAAIIINYTSTIKQMWEKLCCGGAHLSPLWLFLSSAR